MKKWIFFILLTSIQCAQADVRYGLSVYRLPESTWWGSFTVFTAEFITAPITFARPQMTGCTIVTPDGEQCISASFDPQGSGPDKVTFATTAGTIDLFFADGWFTQNGGISSIGGTGSLFISGVPELNSTWLLGVGLASLGAFFRKGRKGADIDQRALTAAA